MPRGKPPPDSPPCRVCGALSEGALFGVDACRACAAFYRRSILDGKIYPCLTGARRCDVVNKDANSLCKQCRLLKCKAVGMQLKEKALSKLMTSSSATAPSPVKEVKREPESPPMLMSDLVVPEASMNEVSGGFGLVGSVHAVKRDSTGTPLFTPPSSVPTEVSPLGGCIKSEECADSNDENQPSIPSDPGPSHSSGELDQMRHRIRESFMKMRKAQEAAEFQALMDSGVFESSEGVMKTKSGILYHCSLDVMSRIVVTDLGVVRQFCEDAFREFAQLPTSQQRCLFREFYRHFRHLDQANLTNKLLPLDSHLKMFSLLTFIDGGDTTSVRFGSESRDDVQDAIFQMIRQQACDLFSWRLRRAFHILDFDDAEIELYTAFLLWSPENCDGCTLSDAAFATCRQMRMAILKMLHSYYRDFKAMDVYSTRIGETMQLFTMIRQHARRDREDCTMLEAFGILDKYPALSEFLQQYG